MKSVCLAMVLAGSALLDCTASDWPRFRGVHGDNKSSETGLLDRFPTNGVPIFWEK